MMPRVPTTGTPNRARCAQERQIVFRSDGGRWLPDGTCVEKVHLQGLGFRLPPGMHGVYTVCYAADGSVSIDGHKQARSQHGRRYLFATGESGESRVQAELLNWSARILRERVAEIGSAS